jgi:7-cyano-7-deazaguanine reductase
MARCSESRRRNRRCRSTGGEISRRDRRSTIVPARVAAIDLNRRDGWRVDRKPLRWTLTAVAKRKRAGELTLLGHSDAKLPASPAEARLETFANPAPERNYRIHFETDDFTSVCPVTGQPDFARIDIDYVPDRLCVESKSLKFYLASYRNERAFNEAVTNRILDDFVKACAPREAIVTAQFSARGGIALSVHAEYPGKKGSRDNK